MRNNTRLPRKLQLFLQWPALMAILLLIVDIWVFALDKKSAIVVSLFLFIYVGAVVVFYYYSKTLLLKQLTDVAVKYGMIQSTLLEDLSIPYAIMLSDGKIVWVNAKFQQMFGEEQLIDKYLSNYIPELNRSVFPKEMGKRIGVELRYRGREYRIRISRLEVSELNKSDGSLNLGAAGSRDGVIAISFTDVTDLKRYMRENDEQKLVSGLIYIDNYEEVMESVEEVRQSLLVALIDRKINQYLSGCDGLVKKMERDKYFFVVKKKNFKEMEHNKFAVLEDVKTVNIGNTMPVTLSIGLGVSGDTYTQNYNYARVAIDLALARGGDQAVVKKGKDISYYGGKREQTAKNTRVKARVKAEALCEFIMAKDQVVVMGHQMADVDSFGAAVGIWRAAKTMEKKAHIVVNDISTSVRPFYNAFQENPAYPDDMFVQSSHVHELVNDNTMVVVVDTNKPSMTECPELLKKSKTIVVFDHHRQSNDIIENTVLSYIEPYASSACEMVAEMLQYIADDVKIANIEASSMYAGIMIDTNNFTNRTGVRTFEAAAFLKRCGANITYVKKAFREDLLSYRVKAEIVASAEVFRDEYAIAQCTNAHIESPTIIGAQAANELLNINGVKASFVLTEYGDKIYVSARSIDEVNVQIIMERLGGGGHINIAGTQFQHTDMEEAIANLKETIVQMSTEGDI